MTDPRPETLEREAEVLHFKTVGSLIAPVDWSLPHDADCLGCRCNAALMALLAAEQRAEEAERLLGEYLARCDFTEETILRVWPEDLEARTIRFLAAPHKAAEEEK